MENLLYIIIICALFCDLSPLLLWPLPLQLRTSHPACRRRTHTAPWCTQPAVWTHTHAHAGRQRGMKVHLFQCVLHIYKNTHALTLYLAHRIIKHPCTASCYKQRSHHSTRCSNTFFYFNLHPFIVPLLFSDTLSMDPFWKTCCSSHTTQYSLSVGILCSEYFIIWYEESTAEFPVITPTQSTVSTRGPASQLICHRIITLHWNYSLTYFLFIPSPFLPY